jgi:uncharacterized caspase-like protein
MSRIVMAAAFLLQVTWLLLASARADERALCPDNNSAWAPDRSMVACTRVDSHEVRGEHLSQVTGAETAAPSSAAPTTFPASPNVAQPSAARAAGRRVALVVGVSKYEHAAILPNTLNDAQDMTVALKRLGFDVETVLDPSRPALEAAVRRYGDRSAGAEASVFHYSGHALEAGGRNWLLPAPANINSERDLRFEAIDLGTVLEQTDGAAQTSIVFLDACRDNPFARRIAGAGRGLSRGLARVDMTASGVLVAFATAPGQVALDGVASRTNSPFTAALLSQIGTAGLEIKALLVRVTKEVVEATNGKQRPWQNSSLESEFYFVPAPASAAPPVTPSATTLEAVFWDSIKGSHDPADFQAYLTQFPTGTFAQLARNRLDMLQRKAPADPAMAPLEKTASAPSQGPTAAAPATASSPLRDQLVARFVALSVAADEAQKRARDYDSGAGRKAIAVAINARRTWRTTGWGTDQAAMTAAQEGCQAYYGEPCALAAVGNKVEPGSDGATAAKDMPRIRYAGRFDPERIPAVNEALRHRADVAFYRLATGPKAAAYHPWGRLFVVTGAAGQFESEDQALAQCNNDPERKGAAGPCYLYAAGDRVVLPQRLTKPRVTPRTISEAFAYLGVPRYSYAYGNEAGHKAIALAPESGQTFRWADQPVAGAAEDRALEGCQLSYRTLCVLLATDEVLQAPDPWKAPRRDMPRLHHSGAYDPERVPLFSGTESTLRSYVQMPAPKAMAIRPNRARVRVATGATGEEAQSKALAACNDDSDALPCFVYAIDDRVVLGQRRTEPAK